MAEMAYSWKDDLFCITQLFTECGDLVLDINFLKNIRDRLQIPGTVINKCNHNSPFVEGN